MTEDQPRAREDEREFAAVHRVRLPGFISDTEVGLGTVVSRATSAVGIRPCGGCAARAARLNRWMAFSRYR